MTRYLILYVVALAVLLGPAVTPALAFLTPLGLAILLFGSLILWRRDGRRWRDLGFPHRWWWPLELLATYIVGLLLVSLLTTILVVSGLVSIAFDPLRSQDLLPGLAMALLWPVLIATTEELIFRGVLENALRERMAVWGAAAASALLWALFHFPSLLADGLSIGHMVIGLLTFTAFGLSLSLAALVAGRSLWTPIGIHYGYNAGFSLLGVFFSFELTGGSEWLTGAGGWIPETGLIGLVFWTLIAAVMTPIYRWQNSKAQKPDHEE